jgi:hypothetical protein
MRRMKWRAVSARLYPKHPTPLQSDILSTSSGQHTDAPPVTSEHAPIAPRAITL